MLVAPPLPEAPPPVPPWLGLPPMLATPPVPALGEPPAPPVLELLLQPKVARVVANAVTPKSWIRPFRMSSPEQ
jgi:hypothetical protein